MKHQVIIGVLVLLALLALLAAVRVPRLELDPRGVTQIVHISYMGGAFRPENMAKGADAVFLGTVVKVDPPVGTTRTEAAGSGPRPSGGPPTRSRT